MKKTLLSQLHNLKDVQPDKQWKAESQEFLRTHINNDVKSGAFSKVMVWVKDFAKVSSQPAFALAAFVLILITGVAFFNPMLSDAKPNDSLYIARIISEKAQVNMTFNKENRDRLSAQFATNHAKDITNLINDPEFHSQEDSEDKIANLSDDFNKEINTARESINSINKRDNSNRQNKDNGNNDVNNNSNDNSDNSEDGDGTELDDEGKIISADTRKDNQGLEINIKDNDSGDTSDGDIGILGSDEEVDTETEEEPSVNDSQANDNETNDSSDEGADADLNSEEENASSTLNQLQSITEEVNKEGGDVDETNKALDDAQRLFNEEKYQEALEKLNEVEDMLEGVSTEISEEPSVE